MMFKVAIICSTLNCFQMLEYQLVEITLNLLHTSICGQIILLYISNILKYICTCMDVKSQPCTCLSVGRPTVKCGIPDALLFNEKDFIAMIMYSRLRSVDINCSYGYFFNKSSAYKCLVVDLKKYPQLQFKSCDELINCAVTQTTCIKFEISYPCMRVGRWSD